MDRAEALIQQGNAEAAWRLVVGPAQGGNARAQFLAGMVESARGNSAASRAWWQKGAAAGSADASTALGYLALGGKGGEPRSSTAAARYFTEGAKGGSAQGMLNLSRLLMIGDGVPMNRTQAAEWRTRAAKLNEPTARALVRGGANQDGPAIIDVATWLGNFGRAAEGIALLRREAEAGSTAAMVVLGRAYYNGQAGGGRDYARARYWWEKAGNNAAALYDLGVLYMYGRGVKSDWGRAEVYFSRAAKLGHPDGNRMAAQMRDLHVAPGSIDLPKVDRSPECTSRGGDMIGQSCIVNGQTLFVQ